MHSGNVPRSKLDLQLVQLFRICIPNFTSLYFFFLNTNEFYSEEKNHSNPTFLSVAHFQSRTIKIIRDFTVRTREQLRVKFFKKLPTLGKKKEEEKSE